MSTRLQPGPPLRRRPLLQAPAPGSFSPPTESLPVRLDRPLAAPRLVSWWVVGTHGGAGVTSLLRAMGKETQAADSERAWPAPDGSSTCPAVLVARRTTCGLQAAQAAARQHLSGGTPASLRVAGLVVVADAPGKAPPRVKQFLDLVAGAFARVWEVEWVEEWRLAGRDEPLPAPPGARALASDMRALTGSACSTER